MANMERLVTKFLCVVLFFLEVSAWNDDNSTVICPKLCTDYTTHDIFDCIASDCTQFPLENIGDPENVRHVDVSFNFIESIPVLPLPSMVYLDISNNKITSIAKGAFAECNSLSVLNISFNSLTEITEDFNWKQTPHYNLQNVNLSHNEIARIEEFSFRDFREMRYLNLSHNKLTNLTINTLAGLEKLESLDLSFNEFTFIGSRFFLDTRQLQYLSLRNNKIQVIERDAFQDVRDNLLRLDLGNNHLVDLTSEVFHIGAFHPFSKLQAIHLDNNKLQKINNDTFGAIVSLQYLFFDKNPITQIGIHRAFPDSLKVFSMKENTQIKKILNGTFSGLPELEEVDITGCYRLTHIDPWAFDGINSNLKRFKASQAGLYSLSLDLVDWLSCDVIELEGNPWDCDCNLRWMQGGLPEDVSKTVECKTPYHLRGRSIDSLDAKDMDCTMFTRYRHRMGVGLICLVTIIFISVTFYLTITYRHHIFGPCRTPKPKGEYRSLYNAPEVDEVDPTIKIHVEEDVSEVSPLKKNPAPTPV